MHRREGNPLHRCLWVLRTKSLWEGKPFLVYLERQMASYKLVVLKLEHASESPGRMVTTHCWALPRVSEAVCLGRGPWIGISSKFPGDAVAAGLETTLLRTTAQGKEYYKWTSPYLNHKYLLMGLLSVCSSLIFVGFSLFVCLRFPVTKPCS